MDIISQLTRDEGVVLHAYQDSLGFWTIGVGHLIDARKGGSIPQSVSDTLLQYDVTGVTQTLSTHLPWFNNLDPVRQAVLINMTFNMGYTHLIGFHNTLSYMQQGNWDAAASEMLNSTWANQVGVRAQRLAQQIRTGEWI